MSARGSLTVASPTAVGYDDGARPAAALRVALLGEQVLTDAAGTVLLRSSRTVALLAHLVVHAGSPQTRQHLAALFWPDSAEEQALTNLRRELHHLRTALEGDPSLVVTSRDLSWRDTPGCRVDVRVFVRERAAALAAAAGGDTEAVLGHAVAAVEQYRGPFLPGGYDDWLLETRAELEQQCVGLLDLIGETRVAAADLAGAMEAVRRRIALRPLEEVGYRRLMELQGDLGDRAGAVSTYHHCASVLERELGVEPDPATRAALNRLLARVGPPLIAGQPAEPGGGRTGLAATGLVGRSAEVAVLRERWHAATRGLPGLVVVRGDAGVGKSRLMAELAEQARQGGAVVAGAQCFGSSGRLALAPVADWLRTPEVGSVLPELEPVWRAEVERLVPSARARTEPGHGPSAMVDAWQRHRFFEGVTRALIAVGRPLLLTVDNLHWCDQETLAFVTFCLGLAGDAPVMVVATMRDEPQDEEPGLASWIVRMRATGLLTEVALRPFDASDTAALGEAIAGRPLDGGEAGALMAATGGYPLYIVEAARGGGAEGGRQAGDLSPVLVGRFEQVSPAARDVAGLAAAVGRDFTLDLLSEAADLDADTVVAAVDELWRRRIVREVGDGYDFSHDLIREAAYARVSPPRRWLLHRRIAQAMELLHADDTDAVSAQLADQYARGGQAARAIAYYRRAAEVASCMFAHGEAIRLHEAALAVVRTLPDGRNRRSEELTVLEGLAAPLNARLGYSSPRLRTTLERAIELAESLGRRESLLGSLVGLWSTQFVHGDTGDAHRTAARALALAEPGSTAAGPAHFAFGGSALGLGRPAEAISHLVLATEFGGAAELSVGTRSDVHGRAFAAHAHWLLGHDDEAPAMATAAIALARTAGNSYSLAVALAYGAITHQLRGDLPELRRTVDELRELCDRHGFAYYRDWGMILDGWSRTDGSGGELVRRGLESLTADGSFVRMPYWLSLSADLHAREGRTDAAVGALDAALAAGRARDDLWWLPEVMRMRAAYDGPEQAVRRLLAAVDLAQQHGSVALVARCSRDLRVHGVADPAFGVPRAS